MEGNGNPPGCTIMQQDLSALFDWSVENALRINVGKCLFMSIGKDTPTTIYTISDTLRTIVDARQCKIS